MIRLSYAIRANFECNSEARRTSPPPPHSQQTPPVSTSIRGYPQKIRQLGNILRKEAAFHEGNNDGGGRQQFSREWGFIFIANKTTSDSKIFFIEIVFQSIYKLLIYRSSNKIECQQCIKRLI
jgi:hypothetical protein